MKKGRLEVESYYRELINQLIELEQSLKRLEALKEDFIKQIDRQINRQAAIVAILCSLALLFWYVMRFSKIFTKEVIYITELQSFFRMFTLSCLVGIASIIFGALLRKLWQRDYLPFGKKFIFRWKLPKFEKKHKEMILKIEEIISSDVFHSSSVPEKYLNVEGIIYLINIMELKEATSLEQALEIIEIEARDSKVKAILIPEENLVKRAQKAINQDLGTYFKLV